MEDLLLSRVEKSFLASFVLFMIIGSLGVVLSTTFLDVYDMTGASISLDFYFFFVILKVELLGESRSVRQDCL